MQELPKAFASENLVSFLLLSLFLFLLSSCHPFLSLTKDATFISRARHVTVYIIEKNYDAILRGIRSFRNQMSERVKSQRGEF